MGVFQQMFTFMLFSVKMEFLFCRIQIKRKITKIDGNPAKQLTLMEFLLY
jgi:hypothetical protein